MEHSDQSTSVQSRFYLTSESKQSKFKAQINSAKDIFKNNLMNYTHISQANKLVVGMKIIKHLLEKVWFVRF